MCRHVELELEPTPAAARDGRRFVADVCSRWDLSALCEQIVLPVSELVTNVVLHSRTPMTLRLSVSSGVVEVSVRDGDPRPPVLRSVRSNLLDDIDRLAADAADHAGDARHLSLHVGAAGSIAAGRGMLVVDAVADEWGVADTGAGKDVWFTLPVPGEWPHTSACPCARAATRRTASGRPVTPVAGPWDVSSLTPRGGSPAAGSPGRTQP